MTTNTYCTRLGIPVPDLDAIVGTAKKLKLFHLMVVAIIEQGEPMTAGEIADRLRRAGVPEIMIGGGAWRGRWSSRGTAANRSTGYQTGASVSTSILTNWTSSSEFWS